MEIKGKTVLIVGCGYLGTRLGVSLIKKGAKVIGTTRTTEKIEALQSAGITPHIFSLSTESETINNLSPDIAVICVAPEDHSELGYERIYGQGVPSLIKQLSLLDTLKNIIYVSSVGVYNGGEGNLLTEEADTTPQTHRQKQLRAAEMAIENLPIKSAVCRLGGIYGPGRNRIKSIKENKISLAELNNFINLIHIDDAVESVIFLMQIEHPHLIYNVVNPDICTRGELIHHLCETFGMGFKNLTNQPDLVRRQTQANRRISSQRLIDIGFKFQYPSFKQGYKELIKGEKEL